MHDSITIAKIYKYVIPYVRKEDERQIFLLKIQEMLKHKICLGTLNKKNEFSNFRQ